MKRLISWVLTLVMILGMVPAVAFLAVESSAEESTAYTYVQQKPATIASSDTGTVGAWYNNGSTFVTTEGAANYFEIAEDGCKDAGAFHVYQDNVTNSDMSVGVFLGGQAAGTYTVKLYVKGDLGLDGQTCKFYPYGCDSKVSNLHGILGTTDVADWTEVSYEVTVDADFYYLIFNFSKYNWATDMYVDNIQLINGSGVDVLNGAGNFYTGETLSTNSAVTGQYPMTLDTTKIGDGYGSAPGDEWVPFAPTGVFDANYGFSAWTDTYYCEIVADGYKDAGSLHMVISQNTAVVINAGMVSGEQYTIGMWVKGTANSNRVLGLYGNGDPAIIGNPEYCGEVAASTVPADWTYLEKTFTANTNSIVLHGNGWGPADIYIDNITLKNSSGLDLISGYGDFYKTQTGIQYTVVQEAPASLLPNDNGTIGAWYINGSTFVTDEGSANYMEVVENGYKDTGALHVYQDDVANNDMSLGVFLGGQAAGTYTVKYNIKGDIGYQDQPFKFYPFGTEHLVSNVSTILGTTEVADWTEVSYNVEVASDFFYLIFYFSRYNWETDAYIDNVRLINSSGVDVLNGAGNFYTTKTVTMNSAVTGQNPVTLDTTKVGNGYGSAPGNEWVPFAPTGEFDPAYGFNAWTDTYYCEIVADGYKDAGSLHMVISQNTAVVINAGMVSGEQYTIGMWVKGTAISNRVLGLYGNGDPAIIGNPEYCGEVAASTVPANWTYLEKTFTANTNSIVLHGNGWGPADIYIDNITLKNSSGQDLIAGYGDFYTQTGSDEEEEDVSGTNIYGKSALFTGDSISWGSDQRAWAARIGEKYEMTYVNASVSGASVSTTRIYRMIEQLEANKTGSFDYVIMHGPTNDAWDEVDVGTLSESFDVADYDVATYAGALEELFYYAREYFPDALLGYIINFRFSSSLDNGLRDMSAYVEMAKKVCCKWGVPYLDLYNNEELTAALKVGTTVYLPDNVHPNAAGYDILTPYIANWMNETVATQEAPVEPEEPTEPEVTEPVVEGLAVISSELERAFRWYWNGMTYEATDHSTVDISGQGANDSGSLHIWQSSAAPSDTNLCLATTMASDLESGSYTLSMNVKGTFYNTEGFYVYPAYCTDSQLAELSVNKKLAAADGVSFVDGAYVTDGWINLTWELPTSADGEGNGFMFLALLFSKYNVGEYYIDNIQVLDPNGNDVLGGAGSFMDSGSEAWPIILPSTGAEILNSNTMYYQIYTGKSNVSVSNHVEMGVTAGDRNFSVTHNGVTQSASNKNVTMQMAPAAKGEPIVFAVTSNAGSIDIPSSDFELMQRADEFNFYDIAITALGCDHSYESVVTAPTLSAQGYTTHTCTLCGESYVDSYTDTLTDVEGWSLTLGGDLSVNFKIAIAEEIQDTAQIVLNVAGESITYNAAEVGVNPDDNCFYVSANVAAAQMGAAITVQVVNGEDASAVKSYSVLQYAQYVLADSSMSSYHQLLKDMLNYGAMAQVYFDYDADNLVNAGIEGVGTAEIPAGAAAEMEVLDEDANINFYGATLLFRDKIAIRYYFTVSGNAEDYAFTVNGTDCKAVQKGEYYYVEIADINPQDLDNTLWASAGGVTVSYCPMNYIVRMSQKGTENLQNLMKALYNYHVAAEVLRPDAV